MRKLVAVTVPVIAVLTVVALISCMQPESVGAQAREQKPDAAPAGNAAPEGKAGPVVAQAGEKEPAPAEGKKPADTEPAGKEPEADLKSFFAKSLHATGEGMRYWYEEENGFMQVTGIPYKDLGCKNCHADSCDKCHAEKKDEKMVFTTAKAKKKDTCLACHKRTGASMNFNKKAGVQDVHFARGMGCTDCHKGIDVHGDGKSYKSMRAPGAVKVSCTSKGCHDKFETKKIYHRVHKRNKNIHCNACHVSSTITCVNCHFDDFLARGGKRVAGENFFPGKSWTLLVNYEGKLTTGNAQTLVGKGKKFVAYVPYFTHSVVKKGRNCSACHGADAVVKMAKGEAVEMARFADGKLTHIEGVVPFVPELIKWPWLDKDKDGKWVELKSDEKPIIQKAAYAKPLTAEQLRKMSRKKKDQ
jgi:hypothetical protein